MIDHRRFLSSLSAEEKARLIAKSNYRGILHLSGHSAVICALGTWVWQGWFGWPLVMVPFGIAMVFLFTLEHECTHKTPFPLGPWNEGVGHACALVMILPFTWFRYFHLAHHKWTNIPEKDPELDGVAPIGFWPLVLHISGVPYWKSMIVQLVKNAFCGDVGAYVPNGAQRRVRLEARVMLGIYLGATLSLWWWSWLFWLWVLPVVVGQPFLRLYLMAEHGRCAQVANMFENTRTTFTNTVVRFLAWNMPYHTEHHVYPAVPFHNLPELHQHSRTYLQETADGYVALAGDQLRHLKDQ